MEIVLVLMLVLGLGLLLGPRVARRRRIPAHAATWSGTATRGVRTRSLQHAPAEPAPGRFEPPAPAGGDEELWDDDLDWVDEPAAAEARPAAPPEEAPAAPPAGRTWGERGTPPADPTPTRLDPDPAPAPVGPVASAAANDRIGRLALTVRRQDEGHAPAAVAAPEVAAPAPEPSIEPAWSEVDDADSEWSTGVDVPPPRIARGAAAFAATAEPPAGTGGSRRSFVSRHPVLLVAAYATAGIALIVIGASFVSSSSFRSSGTSTGERTADLTPTPTVARTPAPTPTPTPAPAATPASAKAEPAKAAVRARAAWLNERRSARRDEARAAAAARAKARRARKAKHAKHTSPPNRTSSTGTTPATTNPSPRPAPQIVRPPSPPPCEFCIG
jgi:hypothetical protein